MLNTISNYPIAAMNAGRCTYCLKRIQKCFSHGAEAGHHKRSHKYSIKYVLLGDEENCIINGWPGSEELEFLCAVEQYGLGNWLDISAKCGHHTPQECYEHYDKFYLHGSNISLLKGNISSYDTVLDHSSPLKPSGQERPVQLEPIEQQLLGYMIMRDDFERDYDNDAESLLTRLNVKTDCDDLENALHVAHVNIYTQRLQERQKRKEIARLHGLIYQISAYLTYKKIKRKHYKTESKFTSAQRHKPIPVLQSQRKRSTPQSSPVSPPAGSWLAAPFALQSSGPTRGIPVVVPGVASLTQDTTNKASDLDDYDPFFNAQNTWIEVKDENNINEKLKPFLRYFTPTQAKQFLNNLHHSHRISSPLKGPSELRSQVYVAAPQNAEPIHPLLVGHPMFGFPTATTGVSSCPNSTLPLSPRRSITAALRSAGTESQQSDTPHRRRRRRYRHGGNTPCQLLHDGYGVFAISLKKLVNSNSDAVASDKLLKIVKLGLAVSKFLEDSNLSKDFSHLAHAFQPNHHNGASFLNSSSSSNNQSIDQSPQQSLHQNGSQNGQFSLGLDPPIKLEPGDSSFNFPFSAYHRQWSQITNNRVNINLDGEIHELPGDGSPIKLFECSLCGKVFNRRDKVKRHLSELHHGIKRHQCATCFRLFSRNDKLVRHIMTVHQALLKQSSANQRQQSTHSTQQEATHSSITNTSTNNVISTTPSVSSSSAGVAGADPNGISSPPAAAVSTSTASSSGTPTISVVTTTSSVDRNMFPVFPNLTGQNVSPWTSSIPSSSNSAFTTTTSATKSESPTSSAVATSSSTEASTSSTALPAFSSSNAHGIFPMFPVFNQPSASNSGPNATTPFSNNAVFPSPIAAFTPVSASYHNGYTPMTSTPVSSSSNQSNCNESTSLTRMLL
ncbi:unnamed protein product [Hymenolepis diminuta]|uniref:Transcriptional adapter 2-alpha n=1 Tax=Hymenolepis diminuta TaxID=6216 RepID=A0A0R3S883_HYMDI|nr:unnamed protein product [Hymenolepis diminuta]